MKSYGFHHLGIDAIQYDELDIAERQKTQRVVELAASRKAIAINPVTVAAGKLVAGRDRLAADLLNGAHAVWCHVVTECTPAELLRIEVEENVRRRDDTDRNQQLARLAKALEAEIKSKAPGNSPQQRKPGRPKTAKGEARAEAAKVAGTTPEAVRRAETRAAAKTEPPKTVPKPPPPIKTFGLPLADALCDEVTRVGGHLQTAATALQRAQAALTAAAEALGQIPVDEMNRKDHAAINGDAARLHDQVHTLADKVRSLVPAAVCPFCKNELAVGVPGGVCPFCAGDGYATVAQMTTPIPAELLREGAAAMVSNGAGGFVPFAKVATKEAAPVSSRGPKAGKPPKDAARLEPAPAPSAAAGHTEGMGPADLAPFANLPPARRIAVAERLHAEGLVSNAGAANIIEHGGPRAPKHRPINVELPGGRVVDALNPPDDLAYSGDDAPPADLPDLVVEPDEAVDWVDDDGQGAA